MARAPIEKPSDELIDAAAKALQDGSTKKAACEIMGIKYNTTRLDKLIAERYEDIDRTARLKKQVRGRAPQTAEIADWAKSYFDGDSMSEIAKYAYRSVAVVKRELDKAGVLIKEGSAYPLDPSPLPEICYSEEFSKGERVWVPGYNCIGEINKEVPTKTGFKGYQVYLLDGERAGMYVHYSSFELGSLRHLKELNIDVDSMGTYMKKEDRNALLGEALRKSRMRSRDRD